ncbi:MAG: hypothetical protein B6U69_01900 [Thermofilum sp. ex4484_15]|nr:MAG: hypothetical protein B6U69_01900 [Thermofilum sp. ex4484_15]
MHHSKVYLPSILLIIIYSYISTTPFITYAHDIKVVINEVELNPGGNKMFNKAWVELYNPSDQVVPIGNWILEVFSNRHLIIRLPLEAIVRPKGYYVLVLDSDLLNPEGTQLVLRDITGKIIDKTPTLKDLSGDDRTWQRYPNGVDTDSLFDWKFKVETKGRSNGEGSLMRTISPATTIMEGVVKEEAVSFHYLDGGFTIQAWYPATVTSGSTVYVSLELRTYRSLNFTVEACYGYGAKSWSDWVTLLKASLRRGERRKFPLKIIVPRGTERGALIIWVKVFFSSPVDYMVVGGVKKPACFQVVFQGPYVSG